MNEAVAEDEENENVEDDEENEDSSVENEVGGIEVAPKYFQSMPTFDESKHYIKEVCVCSHFNHFKIMSPILLTSAAFRLM